MRHHVKDHIEDYLAGMLDPEALRNFEQHITSCRSCEEALCDSRAARSYLQWLLPVKTPPEPGPEFYSRVQKSIEKKMDSGWLGNLAAALHGPRLAYPLLFLFLGLLLMAWSMTFQTDWAETGVLGIPPARFSTSVSSEAGRDLVMISLVELPANETVVEAPPPDSQYWEYSVESPDNVDD